MIKELEDYSWFPPILRKYQLDFIGAMASLAHLYHPIGSIVANSMKSGMLTSVRDLCSGSGTPAIYVHNLSHCIQFTELTDKFPAEEKFHSANGISYEPKSVDVLTHPLDNKKLYTMYNAFHHFSEKEQQDILTQFATTKTNFIFVEILEPTIVSAIQVFVASTIGQLLITPFIQPFSIVRILLTYVLPINILTVLIDGIISVINSKSVKQYQAIIDSVATSHYNITLKKISQPKGNLIIIVGISH